MNRSKELAVAALVAVTVMIGAMLVARIMSLFAPPDYPVVPHTVTAGDTWWTLGGTCDGDRRSAVAYLAQVSSADPDDTLRPGSTVFVCAGVGQSGRTETP